MEVQGLSLLASNRKFFAVLVHWEIEVVEACLGFDWSSEVFSVRLHCRSHDHEENWWFYFVNFLQLWDQTDHGDLKGEKIMKYIITSLLMLKESLRIKLLQQEMEKSLYYVCNHGKLGFTPSTWLVLCISSIFDHYFSLCGFTQIQLSSK